MFFIVLLFQEVKESLVYLQISYKSNNKKVYAIQTYINKENNQLKLKVFKEILISYLFVKALVIFDLILFKYDSILFLKKKLKSN
jgi:hypothetical protein